MLIDLSGEDIYLYSFGEETKIARFSMEKEFPSACAMHRAKSLPNEGIYVIQGPGSFTSLRLGTLVVQTLHTLRYPQAKIYTIPKPLWRSFLVTMHHIEQKVLYVYFIGQKKNCACIYADHTTIEQAVTNDIVHEHMDIVPHKNIYEYMKAIDKSVSCYTDRAFLSSTYTTSSLQTLHIQSHTETGISYYIDESVHSISLDTLHTMPWLQQDEIQPYYGIQPNIA